VKQQQELHQKPTPENCRIEELENPMVAISQPKRPRSNQLRSSKLRSA